MFARQVISKGILIEMCSEYTQVFGIWKAQKKHQVDTCGYYVMCKPPDIIPQKIKGELGFVFP